MQYNTAQTLEMSLISFRLKLNVQYRVTNLNKNISVNEGIVDMYLGYNIESKFRFKHIIVMYTNSIAKH